MSDRTDRDPFGVPYNDDTDCQTSADVEHDYVSYLKELGEEIQTINRANGLDVLQPRDWDDTYKVPAILALIHSEVSEALEAFRIADRENFAEELADVVIRVLDCATGLGVDLDREITVKIEKNRHREYRHGGKTL